jgi:hypothetical protein
LDHICRRKRSWGSYDPGDANPDQLIKIPAHHGDFGYMLWKMEHGTWNKKNNMFNITKKSFGPKGVRGDIKQDNRTYKQMQSDYSKTRASYSNNWFWK